MTFRHLEALKIVSREGSYLNAANELHTTRTNVKRTCENLATEFKHPIFEEDETKSRLVPTSFGQALLNESTALMRSIIHLGEGIRSLQRKGRILRFAASDDFFHDGALSIILSRIDIIDSFRPCYLRMPPDRFKAALLNSECDVYFGAGISPTVRLEIIHLDYIPWSFHPSTNYGSTTPESPADLLPGKWLIHSIGDLESTKTLLSQLKDAGAQKGRILKEGEKPASDEILLKPEPSWMGLINTTRDWPMFLFSAVIKKQHPYAELIDRINLASNI